MLYLLSRAKRWFIDATFKIVRPPFKQLLSIHAYVKKEGNIKHIPLCFVLMSNRRKRDYRAVLSSVVALMPAVSVKEIMSDFESALWRSTRHVLGVNVRHFGCAFHWSQAVWRKIQR
jgi:hypothetical protein